MLAYILAIVVFLGSLAFYLAPFFYPEIHRKGDFYLSGIGMFYALVLWVCAGRITGGVLLGQIAGVSLLGWLALETASLRRSSTSPEAQTEITPQIQEKITNFFQTEWAAIPLLAPLVGLFRPQESEQIPAETEALTTPETTITEEEQTEAELEIPSQEETETVTTATEESTIEDIATPLATET
ncbi:MAG: Ycf66 family protein, partial [Prochloraceae cyanobacterium]